MDELLNNGAQYWIEVENVSLHNVNLNLNESMVFV